MESDVSIVGKYTKTKLVVKDIKGRNSLQHMIEQSNVAGIQTPAVADRLSVAVTSQWNVKGDRVVVTW